MHILKISGTDMNDVLGAAAKEFAAAMEAQNGTAPKPIKPVALTPANFQTFCREQIEAAALEATGQGSCRCQVCFYRNYVRRLEAALLTAITPTGK